MNSSRNTQNAQKRMKKKKKKTKQNANVEVFIPIQMHSNSRVQPFFIDDKSHPQAEVVYECLKLLTNHMGKVELLSCCR